MKISCFQEDRQGGAWENLVAKGAEVKRFVDMTYKSGLVCAIYMIFMMQATAHHYNIPISFVIHILGLSGLL